MKSQNNGRTLPRACPTLLNNSAADILQSHIDATEETVVIEEQWFIEPDDTLRVEETAWIDGPLTLEDFLSVLHARELQSRIHLIQCFPRELLLQAFEVETDDDFRADIAAELARRGGRR